MNCIIIIKINVAIYFYNYENIIQTNINLYQECNLTGAKKCVFFSLLQYFLFISLIVVLLSAQREQVYDCSNPKWLACAFLRHVNSFLHWDGSNVDG